MNQDDLDISFFCFSCDEVTAYLDTCQEIQKSNLNDQYFTLKQNKKNLPEYLKELSGKFPDVEFIHTYAFPLADNTGYSIFKNAQILFQHRESFIERITSAQVNTMLYKNNVLTIKFQYNHYQHVLDFDSKPVVMNFEASIKDLKQLENIPEHSFTEKLKEVLIFDASIDGIDSLVVNKFYDLVKQKELMVYLNYVKLEQKLKEKFEDTKTKKI